ncbi:MAG: hypothetical protein CMC73_04665 [Flavobacteriaceae bacterium]|nr:hypothetical protein [Flavobacteriaceae bacterium]|tara:strand:+ start:887 stop:1411 length:525 start_codon:yes stop_codon:yes gene_type:complete
MTYYTEELTKVTPALEDFIAQCTLFGWKNNSSLKELRWDWCLENGMWYATYTGNTIVSLTGIHTFKDGYRALYRGAQLWPRRVKGLNRYQMQSWGIYDHLPLQIKFAAGKPLYITTNVTTDNSGRMNRIHKSFTAMAKGGMVDYIGDEQIFNAMQSVWKLNVDRYFEIRKIYED